MLEGQSCLLSRDFRSTCHLAYMSYQPDVSKGKRPLEDSNDEEDSPFKRSCMCLDVNQIVNDDGPVQRDSDNQNQGGADSSNNVNQIVNDDGPVQRDSDNQNQDGADFSNNVNQIVNDDGPVQRDSDDQNQGGADSSNDSLISFIGRDMSLNCLLRCSRSDYGSLARINRSFRSLIRSGELYRLRRQNNVVEHWVYFACSLLEWEAFDPIRNRWMHLPQMPTNECFKYSDKESLAVGTELLVFGKEVMMSLVICRYSILSNSWSWGITMNTPRCLFGSASLGEIAILAGGCDFQGNTLSSAELYNSETQRFEILPDMKKPRKMCSGFFMDRKFYVIGGIGGSDSKVLTCGEEYDLDTGIWTEIPDMTPARNAAARENELPVTAAAPPLVAVVNNELYAADYADMEVRKYDKVKKVWATVGRLPERAMSMNGWGLAFRACGDRLIVIGGPRNMGQGVIEINSWVPSEGPPQWDMLAQKASGSFVYNCAIMGC